MQEKEKRVETNPTLEHSVGAARLERATACTPCKNASRLHHAPMKSAVKVQKISIHQH